MTLREAIIGALAINGYSREEAHAIINGAIKISANSKIQAETEVPGTPEEVGEFIAGLAKHVQELEELPDEDLDRRATAALVVERRIERSN